MYKILEGSEGSVQGVELIGAYTRDDVEALKKIFEERIAEGHDKLNILIKIDQLDVGKSHLGAFYEDGRYALQHMDQLRHIAVVGHSKIEKLLIELDNKLLGKPKEELIEKYFDAADIEKAWDFVRS